MSVPCGQHVRVIALCTAGRHQIKTPRFPRDALAAGRGALGACLEAPAEEEAALIPNGQEAREPG